MSRHRITAAEYRELGKRHAEDEARRKLYAIKISPAQLGKLQRNAADPAKARKRKAKRQRIACPSCGATLAAYRPTCKTCKNRGWIYVTRQLTAADITLEREHVQPAVEQYLQAEGLVVIPINSGGATIIGGRACLKGVPDLVTWIPAGRPFYGSTPVLRDRDVHWAVICFLELKRPVGGRYSKEQIAFRDRAIADGCIWVGCTGLEDIKAVIPPRGRQ